MKKSLMLICILIFLSKGTLALTWNEAVSLSEKNSEQLASARKQLESSEWSYRKSFSNFLPQLSASVSMSETESGTAAATSRSYSYGISGSQSLFRGFSNLYGMQSAYVDLEYKRASLSSTQANVFYELRSAFINLYIAQENIVLLEKILAQKKKNSNLIELRYQSGKEDKGNYLTTKASEIQAQYELSSAKRDLMLSRLNLSQILGQDVETVEESRISEKPASVDFNVLLKTVPSYTIAKKQLEKSEISQKSSISGFLPSLSLSASLRKSGSEWPPESESKSWSLGLSYSFFPGGSNIAEWIISQIDLERAREDFSKNVKDLRYSLEQSYNNYQDALETLDVSKISLDASFERYRITEARYLNGLTTYDEWDRIESTYISAQKSLLSARKNALLSEANWYKAYGGSMK